MADLSNGPAGGLTGWLTMQQGLMPVIDSTARLGQFLQDAPLRRAQMEAQTQGLNAQTQGQQFTNANAPTMMQAQLQGSPFEQQKFQQQAQQQALERQMQQQNFNRQQMLAENTLRHQQVTEDQAARTQQRLENQPTWDSDSQSWKYKPGTATQGQSGSVGQTTPVQLSHKQSQLAFDLNKDFQSKLAPISTLERDIAEGQQLLNTSGPLAHQKLNEKLVGMLDPTRNSTILLQGNKQFGNVLQRAFGIMGKFFTGEYTEAQQKMIQGILDDLKGNVVEPTKQSMSKYYKDQAKLYNIPEQAVNVPDFYKGVTAPASGGWAADKEARYQEWLKRQTQ